MANVILTLFIGSFAFTGALWLILALSGQATMNTTLTDVNENEDMSGE